jgi:hypothetical protein
MMVARYTRRLTTRRSAAVQTSKSNMPENQICWTVQKHSASMIQIISKTHLIHLVSWNSCVKAGNFRTFRGRRATCVAAFAAKIEGGLIEIESTLASPPG